MCFGGVDVQEGGSVGVVVSGDFYWDGGVAVFYSGEHFAPEFPVRGVSMPSYSWAYSQPTSQSPSEEL